MNFFVNKAMGIGNSGVEHAQFYRAKCFDQAGIPYKYVFTEFVKNLHDAMEAWHIRPDQVINMWELFVFGEPYLTQGASSEYQHEETIIVDQTNTHRIKKTVTACGLLVVEHLEKSRNKKNEKMLLVSDYQVEIYDYRTMEKK